MKLLATMFTGKAQPDWLADWLHARVQLTGIPDFDHDYVLSSSRPLTQEEFPSALVTQLRSLPEALIQNLLMIRGQGRLRLRIDQAERIASGVSNDGRSRVAPVAPARRPLGT